MRKGILSLLIAALAWSWPSVMIRMLRTDFDIYTQSFFRYAAASIFLFAVGLIFTRRKIIDAAGNLKIFLIPAVIMTINQVFFTAGVVMTSAVISTLMGRMNAILIPAISCIFYADERRVVGNRHFLLGALLALIGVMGVILGREAIAVDGFNLGTIFIAMGALSWSIYAVYIKRMVHSVDPVALVAFVSLLSTLFFLPVVLIFGDLHKIVDVSVGTTVLLCVSGILGVGVGNIFYYYAIRHVEISIAAIFFLLMPLSVGVIAFVVLGETLTRIQVISGAVLVIGCWSVTRLAKKTRSQVTEQPESARSI
ncbi:DMT family transporter [Candidatus Poribacteria bacterium]